MVTHLEIETEEDSLFVEDSLFYRALLQKRPRICRSLLIVATPYLGIFFLSEQDFFIHVFVCTAFFFPGCVARYHRLWMMRRMIHMWHIRRVIRMCHIRILHIGLFYRALLQKRPVVFPGIIDCEWCFILFICDTYEYRLWMMLHIIHTNSLQYSYE